MKRDSFIFYRSFYEAMQDLTKEDKADIFDAICEKALNFNDPELKGIAKGFFTLIKPQIEANIRKFENGKRPKTKQSGSKPEANHKQTISKHEGNVNVNVNVNGNKEKIYLYSKFYDSEIEKSKNQKYNQFVKYLHGENMLKQKLSGVLSIKNQLTGEQFEKILVKCEANKLKMGDILTKIENDKKYYKDKTNLYRTLLNWADGRYIK